MIQKRNNETRVIYYIFLWIVNATEFSKSKISLMPCICNHYTVQVPREIQEFFDLRTKFFDSVNVLNASIVQ